MLYVYDNATDITQYVEENSIQISHALTNRVDTASLSTINSQKITAGHSIYIYEGVQISAPSNSGQPVIYVSDPYGDVGKWLYATDIIIDIGGSPVTYAIQSVNTTSLPYSITLTTNLLVNVTTATKVGRLLFGGIAMTPAEKETTVSGQAASTLEYAVQCSDWTALLNRQNVIQEYQNMYIREITGRALYNFCAFDTSRDIDLFESAWTQAGTGLVMANSTDRLQGAYSQSSGTSGSGSATFTKTISAANLSSYTNMRWWWKVGAGYGGKVSAMKLRIGTDSSNYFEYSLSNIGVNFEDCWNFESVVLAAYSSITGSPVLTSIAWVQLLVTASAAIPTGNIYFDHMLATNGSFTIQNAARGTNKFVDVRVPFQAPSQLFSELCKGQALFWYIDPAIDLHIAPASSGLAAPWAITDSSANYVANTLVVTPDITMLRNRVTVIGGLAPSTSLYTQNAIADGAQTSFALDYPPSTLSMTVAGTPQTVGVEGLTDETTVQWVFNFANKVIRKTSGTTTPTNGTAIVFTYFPNLAVLVRVTSPTSIATMKALTGGDGVYDGPVINDTSIVNFADAITRANAELTQYANAGVTVEFETEMDGLRVGQIITITDTTRGISAVPYLIQKIDIKQRYRDRWSYSINASSTIFGLVEFIQMLLKQSTNIGVSPSQFLASVLNSDEAMTFTDSVTFVTPSKTAQAAKKVTMNIDWVAQSGLSIAANGALDPGKEWYGAFSGGESGTIAVDASSHYNNSTALKITTTVGGASKEAFLQSRPQITVPAATSLTIGAMIELPAALTNVSAGGLRLLVKEYSSAGALLATNTIFSGITAAQDFNYLSSTFTTNASTSYVQVYISLYQAAGVASITHITITAATTETAVPPGIASFSQAS